MRRLETIISHSIPDSNIVSNIVSNINPNITSPDISKYSKTKIHSKTKFHSKMGPMDTTTTPRPPIRLILLRHGESEINAACNEIGPPGHPGRDIKYYDPAFVDPKLTVLGRTQAFNAADSLRAALAVAAEETSSPQNWASPRNGNGKMDGTNHITVIGGDGTNGITGEEGEQGVKNGNNGDVVVLVSTLTRALETATIALSNPVLKERIAGWYGLDACRETSLEFNVHGAGADTPGRVLDQPKACNQRRALSEKGIAFSVNTLNMNTSSSMSSIGVEELESRIITDIEGDIPVSHRERFWSLGIDFEKYCVDEDIIDHMEDCAALDARIDRFVDIVREVARGGSSGSNGNGGSAQGEGNRKGGRKQKTVVVVGHYVFFYRFLRRYFPNQEAGLRNAECRVLELE